MNAFLVIDMQKRFGWDQLKKLKKMRLDAASNIIAELQRARLASQPIVFIVCDPRPEHATKYQLRGNCEACDHEIGMLDFLNHLHKGSSFEPVFFKGLNDDAFSNPNLGAYLLELGVTEVTLVGCNTSSCVLETAQGAIKTGLNATLLANCSYDSYHGFLWSQEDYDELINLLHKKGGLKYDHKLLKQIKVVNYPHFQKIYLPD